MASLLVEEARVLAEAVSAAVMMVVVVVLVGCGRSETGLLWPWQQLLINHPGIPEPHGPLPGRPYGWSRAMAIIARGNTASKRAQPT